MRAPHAPFAVLAVSLGVLLCGCVRPGAVRYYTLAALAAAAPPAAPAPSLGVGPVRLSPYLRQDAMVVRLDPHRLEYSDFSVWAEAPEEAVAVVLRENLARLTGARPVLRHPWRLTEVPSRQVAVEISAFELGAAGEAVLTARWEIRDAAGALLHGDGGTYREPVPEGLESLADALSRALLRLSQGIAAAVTR